jgi:hypothetical protein
MPYTPEIYLDPDTEERLRSYLREELINHRMEKQNRLDDLMMWQTHYWAEPSQEEATFPFRGASVLVIPLSAIAVETVAARTITKLFGFNQFVSGNPKNPEWSQKSKPVERFMEDEMLTGMKIKKPLTDSILCNTKFGTMIGKVGYCTEIRYAVRDVGGIEEEIPVVVKQGPEYCNVMESSFLMPFYATDPQTSPWVGEEHSRTPFEVMNLEQSGFLRKGTFDKLKAWVETNANDSVTDGPSGRDFEKHQEELERKVAVWPKRINWVEIWVSFNVDGNENGKMRDIVVHYHEPTDQFMSIRNNWNPKLRRPYRIGTYFPVEGRWAGIGICKQNEQFMLEITTQHRQRLDNATLANMSMFKIHKNAGYGPGEPIFPGKMWFVDEMDHIDSIKMGDVLPSSYNNEQSSLIYSQQRTGVNEVTLGMPQVGTPGTATSDLARIQEGQNKFDFHYQNTRDFVDTIIIDTALCVKQFGPTNYEYFDLVEGGQSVAEFFQHDYDHIEKNLIITLRTASQQENKILDRQNWVQVAGLLTQYYTGLIQIAQMGGDPTLLGMVMKKALTASTEAMRQILETFNIRNIDEIVMKEFLLHPEMISVTSGAPPDQAGVTGAQENNIVSRLPQLASMFSGILGQGPNGNGGIP